MMMEGGKSSKQVAGSVAVDSKVWKNLLAGKQAVPTVACPSCGAQVPEFRIHSHLDTCLSTLPVVPEQPVPVSDVQREVSDIGDDSRRGRPGRGKGQGKQGRKRGAGRGQREGLEEKRDGEDRGADNLQPGGMRAGKKRARTQIDSENRAAVGEENSPPLSPNNAGFQQWEYTVVGLDELRKSGGDASLSDVQRKELLTIGVLSIESKEMSAMILQLDRLLEDFSTDSSNSKVGSRVNNQQQGEPCDHPQSGVHEQLSNAVANSDILSAKRWNVSQAHGNEALDAWWGQWVTEEWPEGPLPSGFQAGLPHVSKGKLIINQKKELDSIGDTSLRFEMGCFKLADASNVIEHQEATSSLKYSAQPSSFRKCEGPAKGANITVSSKQPLARSTDDMQFETANRNENRKTAVGMASDVAMARLASNHGLNGASDLGPRCSVNSGLSGDIPQSTTAIARVFSPSKASTSNAVNTRQTSPADLQACPICGLAFSPNSSNMNVNMHVDECLNQVADLLD